MPADAPVRGSRSWWAAVIPRPTWVTAALMAATVLMTPFVARPLGYVFAALVIGAAIGDAALTVAPWKVPIARQVQSVIVLGRSAAVRWTLRCMPRHRGTRVWVTDAFAPSLGATARRHEVVVTRGAQAVMQDTLTPWRRGTFHLDAVSVRVLGPLGLTTRQHTRSIPDQVQVHPAFPSRDATLLRLERERLLTAGNRLTRSLGGGTEFDHLSEYRYGDDVRRVDWSATARMGHPVVRRYQIERDRTVLVLLEHGRASATVVAGTPRLDHGMDAAMALLTAAMEVGDRGGLLSYAGAVSGTVAPARRTDQVARAARALHLLEPELVEADHRRAFAAAVVQQRRRALLVIITDLGAAAAIEGLTSSLPVLTARHEVVVASVTDPLVTAVADHSPDDVLAAHHAAGAARVLARREHAAATVRGLGARVVDAPPLAVAEQLVDVYLDLKGRGRI
ncbi:MAG: hypothetical protein ACI970_000153 [Myxococcota bacterium]|jgi:uncharacterized protein (DUF58 family)